VGCKLFINFAHNQVLSVFAHPKFCIMGMKTIVLTLIVLLSAFFSFAQVTTSSITGVVRDEKGEPLIGATVKAVHTPSGTVYGTTTLDNGRYNIPNMRVGGPYTITISYVSYKEEKVENVNLPLGQTFRYDVKLETEATALKELVVSGKQDRVFNSSHTGAQTTITREQLQSLPTLNRGIADFTKLTPQSGKGLNFGGRNSLYNRFTVDGSMFNNAFGLSDLPGGQTNAQPISLDAIDQLQVNLAPYDVKLSGFTGANINAVTRSGTNEFSGSVYSYFKSENLTGSKIRKVDVSQNDYTLHQYGFRLGGPIIKNKLFFFINGEMERQTSPGSTWLASRPGLSGANVSRVRASAMDSVSTILKGLGWNPGAYENYEFPTNNDKATIRLDWNINDKNKLNIRYSYLNAYRDIAPSTSNSNSGRGPNANTLIFENMKYRQYNKINSIVAELNTTFSNKYANNLSVTYSAFRDYRTTFGGPAFPVIDIEDGSGRNYISAGSEPFSGLNSLNQDLWQAADNFNIYSGKHTFTLGVAGEYFKFSNAFAQFVNGQFRFKSLSDFVSAATDPASAVRPTLYQLTYSALPGNPKPAAKLSVAQASIYAQDAFQIKDNFRLTYGLRIDIPFYPSSLPSNPIVDTMTFRNGEKLDVGKLPKTQIMWSPRVGFNWDVNNDQRIQLRGGTGIFTGAIPYVWAVNQAGQSGLLFGSINASGAAANAYPFSANPSAYVPPNPQATPNFAINVIDQNFKYPQVWRSNLAADVRLPGDVIATVEGIYTKDLHAVFHRDANLVNPTGKSNGPGTRDTFPGGAADRINQRITNAIVLDNTTQGYSYSLSAQFQKTFDFGLFASLAYTYTDAKDITSSPGSQAASAYNGNQVVNDPNNPVLSYTNYMVKHRVIGMVSWSAKYAKILGTTLAVVYEGSPFSDGFNNTRVTYTYSGNINKDLSTSNNDLVYVPKNQSDIVLIPTGASDTRTPDQMWAELNDFISKNKYLDSRRGKYTERNGGQYPWFSRFDVRFTEDIDFSRIAPKSKSKLQFTLDIVNFSNLLNSNWGVAPTAPSSATSFLVWKDNLGAGGQPRYTFTKPNASNKTFIDDPGVLSRWQMQIGLRYIFN
jgi:hypothetical protein